MKVEAISKTPDQKALRQSLGRSLAAFKRAILYPDLGRKQIVGLAVPEGQMRSFVQIAIDRRQATHCKCWRENRLPNAIDHRLVMIGPYDNQPVARTFR